MLHNASLKSRFMVRSKIKNQIMTKNSILLRAILPSIAYWDLLLMNSLQINNLYIGTALISILGFWGFIKNNFLIRRHTLLIILIFVTPSIIGYIYYGTSFKAIFSLFLLVGISFYVNYFVSYQVLEKIIYQISRVASFLSIILVIFFPILEEEGRLFLGSNEPSHIAIALIGPLFYLAYKKEFFYFIPIMIAILLTQSLTVFMSGFIFILFFRNHGKNISTSNIKKLVLLMLIFYVATLVPAIAWRLNSFSVLWVNFSFSNINGTFFSFLSHAMTYIVLVLPNYAIGLGFFNYQEFLSQPEIQEYYSNNPVFQRRLTNQYGGHSMLPRMLNELSLFATALIYQLSQRLIKLFKKEDFAVFAFLTVLILSRCLKLAGYFDFGFIFFVMAILIIPFNAAPKVSHYL